MKLENLGKIIEILQIYCEKKDFFSVFSPYNEKNN